MYTYLVQIKDYDIHHKNYHLVPKIGITVDFDDKNTEIRYPK